VAVAPTSPAQQQARHRRDAQDQLGGQIGAQKAGAGAECLAGAAQVQG